MDGYGSLDWVGLVVCVVLLLMWWFGMVDLVKVCGGLDEFWCLYDVDFDVDGCCVEFCYWLCVVMVEVDCDVYVVFVWVMVYEWVEVDLVEFFDIGFGLCMVGWLLY